MDSKMWCGQTRAPSSYRHTDTSAVTNVEKLPDLSLGIINNEICYYVLTISMCKMQSQTSH